ASSVAAPPGQLGGNMKSVRRATVAAPPGGAAKISNPCASPPMPQRRPLAAQPPQEPPSLHCAPSLPVQWASRLELDPEAPVLGGGAFAQVLRARERATGTTFAVKVLSRPAFACRGIEAQIHAELSALQRCAEDPEGRGLRIVTLIDSAEECGMVYLRLHLCRCDLQQMADAQPAGRLAEAETRRWAAQLMEGLRDLHALGILHRDIKPANLLCGEDGGLRIADFGWCALASAAPRELAGTFQYMAPEVLGQQEVQAAGVDLWSAGVTVMQLLTGQHLLQMPGPSGLSHVDPQRGTAAKVSAILADINRLCPPQPSSRPTYLSEACWSFLRQLLVPRPQERTTAVEALAHDWVLPDRVVAGPEAVQVQAAKQEDSKPMRTRPAPSSAAPCPSLPAAAEE
ncbi:unnamed protein product, partial [Polarella glacialis]